MGIVNKLQDKLREQGKKNATLGFAIEKADEYVKSHSEEDLRKELEARGINPDSEDKRDKIKIKRIFRKLVKRK